jgi:hypothetical protein
MIWRPQINQRVRLRYRKDLSSLYPHHGKYGRVVASATGPGPINALVLLDSGIRVIVNKGHLEKE